METTRHGSDPLEQERDELLAHVAAIRIAAAELAELPPPARRARIDGILSFLRHRLVPHAEMEEGALFPAVERLLHSSGAATAAMAYDHRAIAERIARLTIADPADVDELHDLLYGLAALLTLHLEKEQRLYGPLIAADPEAAANVRRALGHGTRPW